MERDKTEKVTPDYDELLLQIQSLKANYRDVEAALLISDEELDRVKSDKEELQKKYDALVNKLPKTKITEGEWIVNNLAHTKVHGLDCSEIFTHHSGDGLGEWIAYVRGNTEAERIANANIMASARDMLKLIQQADAWLSFNNKPSIEEIQAFRQSLQEVIKKATA